MARSRPHVRQKPSGKNMRLQDWEATIHAIANECNRDLNGANKILMAWRVKLEEEPHLLQPFQIDQIVREVRLRLIEVNR